LKINILDKLCCPSCKNNLIAEPFSAESLETENIIINGILLCSHCKKWFPVISYVPVMLNFKTSVHERFAKEYSDNLKLYPDYAIPDGQPKPGELSVQETFSEEWDIKDISKNELTFVFTSDDLIFLNKNVSLRNVSSIYQDIETILNVGCGIGAETIALNNIFNNSEIYAMDLNFSLLRSGPHLKTNNNINLFVASLFDLPFKEASFDFVFSHGVLHHTFSTYKALESISAYVKKTGYLFIWVYGLADEYSYKGVIGVISRLKYLVEKILRPLVSRSPKILRNAFFSIISIILHPLIKMRVYHRAEWDLKETNHGVRDWLSPRYAYRSSYNEVVEWFENLGFKIIDLQSPQNYRKLFHKQLNGVGLTGQKL
jgi:ubiquinone/menaquinone biosynthesis C-methylase UbiE/uncharacterized protein YbaR (Trm112 family)